MPPKRRRTMSVAAPSQEVYENGALVWAKFSQIWWCAIVIATSESDNTIREGKYQIFWFGDHRISEVTSRTMLDFKESYETMVLATFSKASKTWIKGVGEALQELYQNNTKYTPEEIRNLATTGLPEVPNRINRIPEWTTEILYKSKQDLIDSNDMVEEQEIKKTCSPDVKEQINMHINQNQPLLTKLCVGCYSRSTTFEHPLFQGNICKRCQERIRDTLHVKGDDGICYYCAICGFPGQLVICEDIVCGRVYCKICIQDLAAPAAWEVYVAKENWACFLCSDIVELCGVIFRQQNYLERIQELYKSDTSQFVPLPKGLLPGTKLRVLSLFDGLASGLQVLDNLRIPVAQYYGSEVDLNSINITKLNFGDRITQLGDIHNIDETQIEQISPIHLVFGGSPCNELSLVNPYRKGLYDLNGSGPLFFEFYRILCNLKKYNPSGFYWIFENVAAMPLKFKATISRYLQCQPALVDAASVSPQCRPRLFWGNLPYLYVPIPKTATDLQTYLMPGRKALIKCVRTVTTRSNSLKQGNDDLLYPVIDSNGKPDVLWITELEQVFGFPLHYTDTGNLSVMQRQHVLGKAWSVSAVTCLLRFLKDFYQASQSRKTI